MRGFTLVVLVCMIGLSLANSDGSAQQNGLSRQKRQAEIFENTRKLIEQLATDLRASAQKAFDSIATFSSGIQDQTVIFRKKVEDDVGKLKLRVEEAIKFITDRFQRTGAAVKDCVHAQRSEADSLFNTTFAKTLICAEDRISEMAVLIENLASISKSAVEGADNAMKEMTSCTDGNHGNFLNVGACLGAVALRTEIKGASFIANSGLSVARINLSLATLPAALEVCAGARIVEAGLGTAKIAMQIATCSATSISSIFSGGNSNYLKLMDN